MRHRNSPQCAPTSFAKYFVLFKPAVCFGYCKLTKEILALGNFHSRGVKLGGLRHCQLSNMMEGGRLNYLIWTAGILGAVSAVT
jgi:hypothetical protein